MTSMQDTQGFSRTVGVAQNQVSVPLPNRAPMVFVVGPPGSGKSVLGQRVCAELELRFVDLADDGRIEAALQELVGDKGADVVALPWAPATDARWLELCRRSGETVALWAHPLDMQARSGAPKRSLHRQAAEHTRWFRTKGNRMQRAPAARLCL